jgi:hypothetical protein
MSETVNKKELIQCARCKSTMLVKYFSINKKGQLYKTCDNCRQKRWKNTIEKCQQVAEERGGKCLSKKYNNCNEKMLWECSEGHQWEAIFHNIKNKKSWCPECAIINNSMLLKNGIEDCHQVAEERGGRCLSTKYKNNNTKMLWECDKGHQWGAWFKSIKNHKSWCPYCAGYRSEELARKLMEELYGEKFQKVRPEWLGGLELDGYNEDLKIWFDYNGIQHDKYRPHFHRNGIEDLYKQQKRDHRKYEICKERGIHLIVIPNEYSYQDEDAMRNFLEKNL